MTTYRGQAFCAIDGESVEGRYVLLADSTGQAVENIDGLSTFDCLTFLTRRLPKSHSWTRVGYGLHFDLNHWISDFDPDERVAILKGDVGHYWRNDLDQWQWGVQYVANRIITIWHYPAKKKITIYDCLGMFRQPFVQTCDDWLFGNTPEIIREGKQRRERFARWDMEFVREYNAAECAALVHVLEGVDAYLGRLPGGGVHLRGWYGAGAIAASWLRRAGVRRLMRRFDLRYVGGDLLDAFARAYHGGRVETRLVGTVGPVWRYDIHSAYAWAACHMGRVTYRWAPVESFNADARARMSVYRVSWKLPAGSPLGPFPVRDQDERITYPLSGSGWYWWLEIKAARDIWGASRMKVDHGNSCIDGWRPIGDRQRDIGLATVLKTMYQYRWWSRQTHEPGRRLMKLALAAVWGKFAQRRSANDDGDEPGFFYCQPWAGWITSCVRAAILKAVQGNENAVIAIATDGIVTNRELPQLRISDDLGAWSVERYSSGTFLLPGLFRLVAEDGHTEIERTRGFERAAMQWEPLLDQLEKSGEGRVWTTRFIGHLLPDLYPEKFGEFRLRFMNVPIRVAPAAIMAKRLGGDRLLGAFDYRREHVWLGAHDGNQDFLSFGLKTIQPDMVEAIRRAEADGEMDARI